MGRDWGCGGFGGLKVDLSPLHDHDRVCSSATSSKQHLSQPGEALPQTEGQGGRGARPGPTAGMQLSWQVGGMTSNGPTYFLAVGHSAGGPGASLRTEFALAHVCFSPQLGGHWGIALGHWSRQAWGAWEHSIPANCPPTESRRYKTSCWGLPGPAGSCCSAVVLLLLLLLLLLLVDG